MEYRTVKALCCENTGLLHLPAVWALEKSEGTDFNHGAIMSEDKMIFDAVLPESRAMFYREWSKDFKVIRSYEIKMSDKKYNDFMAEVKSNVPKKYSVWQCILIWICNSIGVLEHYIERTIWNGNKAMICTEFVAAPIAVVLGYDFKQSLDTVGLDELEEALIWAASKFHE